MTASVEPRRSLPRGRNALDPAVVEADQRRRVLDAMVEPVDEHGYGDVRVTDLVARAGVAKPRFYELFESKLGCMLALIDDQFSQLISKIGETVDPNGTVPERVAQGMRAIAEFAREDPRHARLIFVDGPMAGREALERIDALKEVLAGFYISLREEARERDPSLPPMSPLRAHAIVGAISETIAADLRHGGDIDVQLLADEMTEVVVTLASTGSS